MGKYVFTVVIALAFGALVGAVLGAPLANQGGIAFGALLGAATTGWFVARQPDIQASLYFEHSGDPTLDEGSGVLLSDLLEAQEVESRLDAIEATLASLRASANGSGE